MNNVPYISKTKNFPYNLFSEKFGGVNGPTIQGAQKRKEIDLNTIINERQSPASNMKNSNILTFPMPGSSYGLCYDRSSPRSMKNGSFSKLKGSASQLKDKIKKNESYSNVDKGINKKKSKSRADISYSKNLTKKESKNNSYTEKLNTQKILKNNLVSGNYLNPNKIKEALIYKSHNDFSSHFSKSKKIGLQSSVSPDKIHCSSNNIFDDSDKKTLNSTIKMVKKSNSRHSTSRLLREAINQTNTSKKLESALKHGSTSYEYKYDKHKNFNYTSDEHNLENKEAMMNANLSDLEANYVCNKEKYNRNHTDMGLERERQIDNYFALNTFKQSDTDNNTAKNSSKFEKDKKTSIKNTKQLNSNTNLNVFNISNDASLCYPGYSSTKNSNIQGKFNIQIKEKSVGPNLTPSYLTPNNTSGPFDGTNLFNNQNNICSTYSNLNSKNSMFFLNKKNSFIEEKLKSNKDFQKFKLSEKGIKNFNLKSTHLKKANNTVVQMQNTSAYNQKKVSNKTNILNKKKSQPSDTQALNNKFETMSKSELIKLIMEQESVINIFNSEHKNTFKSQNGFVPKDKQSMYCLNNNNSTNCNNDTLSSQLNVNSLVINCPAYANNEMIKTGKFMNFSKKSNGSFKKHSNVSAEYSSVQHDESCSQSPVYSPTNPKFSTKSKIDYLKRKMSTEPLTKYVINDNKHAQTQKNNYKDTVKTEYTKEVDENELEFVNNNLKASLGLLSQRLDHFFKIVKKLAKDRNNKGN